jgi:multidrug resistance efflux pump/molybdopterin converting factor small subunit
MKRLRIIAWGIVAAVLVGVIGVTVATRRNHVSASDGDIPLALVKRGELDVKVYTTGELKANQSVTVSAPPIGGGSLQITKLLHTGTPVKKGDVVVEFDPSEQVYKLEQSRSELLQAEQDIIKAKDDAAVQTAQDKVALLKARFDVRRAQLELQKNELVSTIDAQKNQLALDQANRALTELEHDIQSHGITTITGVDLAREKWKKAKLSMDQAQQNIQKIRVVSPIDGLVAIQKNAGDFAFSGMSIPDFHEGDQAQPGSAIAQVIDSREMELSAKVSENDRAGIVIGQPAEIEFDALPGRVFHGALKSASAMVQRTFFWEDAGSKYDVSIQLTDPDVRLLPGLTAQIVIVGNKEQNTLYIPRQALFQKEGAQTIFLKKGASFKQLSVNVHSENETRAAIEGLKEGDEVALIDPMAPRKGASPAGAQALGGGSP